MHITTLESERLILRPFSLQDSSFIIELLNTEGWIKYIGDRNIKTIEEAENYLANGPMKSYEMNGFGLGLVELKSNHKPVGMCGLIKRDYLDHPDIGFAFLPAYTGKGYAYEIAKETVQYGLQQLQKEKIAAITLPGNASSVKLLERLGFQYNNNFVTSDTKEELSLYSIIKENL